MLAMHSSCSSEHRPSSRVVVAASISRRSSENGSLAKRNGPPVWIHFRLVALVLLIACAATDLFPSHINMFVAHATNPVETGVDVEALDRRVDAALRLLEASDPAAGEAELRDMADRCPFYAKAPFYLGLLSQSRSDPETAISFYAATLRAGKACILWLRTGSEMLACFLMPPLTFWLDKLLGITTIVVWDTRIFLQSLKAPLSTFNGRAFPQLFILV